MANDSRFIMIPNMIDDSDLSVSAFRLYAHLRRVCGNNRTCTEGVRLLSKRCNMSSKTVGAAKTELKEKGLIKIKEIKTPSGIGHEIKLINLKDLNQAVYVGTKLKNSKVSSTIVETARTAQTRYKEFVKKPRKLRSVLIPEDFSITSEMENWASDSVPDVDIELETERFCYFSDFNNLKSSDWVSFWKNWMLKNAVCKKR